MVGRAYRAIPDCRHVPIPTLHHRPNVATACLVSGFPRRYVLAASDAARCQLPAVLSPFVERVEATVSAAFLNGKMKRTSSTPDAHHATWKPLVVYLVVEAPRPVCAPDLAQPWLKFVPVDLLQRCQTYSSSTLRYDTCIIPAHIVFALQTQSRAGPSGLRCRKTHLSSLTCRENRLLGRSALYKHPYCRHCWNFVGRL